PFVTENIAGMLAHMKMGYDRLKPVIDSLLPTVPELIERMVNLLEEFKENKEDWQPLAAGLIDGLEETMKEGERKGRTI
ncbi:MAG: hypothetical protein ACXQTR_05215, partial [Candidatus Methanospirareceae archaeon]